MAARPVSWFCLSVLLTCLLLGGLPAAVRADDTSAYDAAVLDAQAHAAAPGPWTVSDLKVIAGPGSGDGNSYVGGRLVASTFTKQSYFTGAYSGKTMTVYGSPSTSATWVTVGGELSSYWTTHGVTAATVKAETSRVLGMSMNNSNSMLVEMLVSPTVDSIQRPTKDPSITSQPSSLGTNAPFVRPAGMSDAAYANFTAYYANWEAAAYGASHFPWTQLGYTYRWGLGDGLADIRGLSEFIVPGGTRYTVYAMYSLQSALYTDGNGSGDFHVTGDLDTLWTGRQFQPRGDTVRIESGVTVAGGQGLLVSSPGYTVVNRGTITGTTAEKFGLAGTGDIAVLFLGQAPAADSLAEPYGTTTTLINTGRIDSPGTAVQALAGDTVIVSIGDIRGGVYAVRTGAGNDNLEVRGGSLTGQVDLGGGNDTMTVTGGASLGLALSSRGGTPAPVRNVAAVRLDPGTTLSLAFDTAGYVTTGQTFSLIQAGSLSLPAEGLAVTSNRPMLRFVTRSDGATLTATALRDLGWYGRNCADHSLGAALDAVAAGYNPVMAGIVGMLDQYGAPSAVAAQLAPAPQTRTTVLAADAASAFTSAFAARLGALRGRPAGRAGLAPAGFRERAPGPADLADLAGAAVSGQAAFGVSPWQAALPAAAGDSAPDVAEGPLETFASFYGAHGQAGTSGDAPGYDASHSGGLGGFGLRVRPGLRLGLVGGYALTMADFAGGKGTSQDNVWRVGPYCAWDSPPYTVDALLAYGSHRTRTERPVLGATAESRGGLREVLGFVRAGRTVDLGPWLFAEPFAEGRALWLHREGSVESGGGAADLAFPAADSASVVSVLGLRLAGRLERGDWALAPEVRGGWRHEYADTAPPTRAAFAAAPDQAFTVTGGGPDRDQARLGAGVTLSGPRGRALAVHWDTTLGATRSDMALSAGVRLAF